LITENNSETLCAGGMARS